MKPSKSTWEEEFDKKFGRYGTYTEKGLDALETEVQFRLKIKSFIEKNFISRATLHILEASIVAMIDERMGRLERLKTSPFMTKTQADLSRAVLDELKDSVLQELHSLTSKEEDKPPKQK